MGIVFSMTRPLKRLALYLLPALLSTSAYSTSTPAEAPKTPPELKWPPSARVEKIEKNKVHFAAAEGVSPPSALETELLGTLSVGEGQVPYLMLEALPPERASREENPKTIQEERAIFMIRADGTERAKYVKPGRVYDRKTRETLIKSRAFFGKCLPGRGDIYVAFQTEQTGNRRKRRQSSVLISEPNTNGIEEQLIVKRLPSENTAIQQVKRKNCTEIAGKERATIEFSLPY
jgi:hypothetical protein